MNTRDSDSVPVQTGTLPGVLPKELASVLRAFAFRERLNRVVFDLAIFLLVIGGLVAAFCLFDRLFDVEPVWRMPFPWITLAAAVVLSSRLLWRCARPIDYDRIALHLDRASGDQRDHLRTLLDTAKLEPSRLGLGAAELRQRSVAQGVAYWSTRLPASFCDIRRTRMVAVGAGVMAGMFLVAPHVQTLRAELLIRRLLFPAANLPRPTSTWFETSQPLESIVRAGDAVGVSFTLAGVQPKDPAPRIRIRYVDGAVTAIELVHTSDDRWEATLPDVRQDFSMTATLQDARSSNYMVRVLPRPTILQTTVTYDFPSYTRLKSRTERIVGRTVAALEGTKLRIEIASNTPLREVIGAIGKQDARFRVSTESPRVAVQFLTVEKLQQMEIRLVSADGIESKQESPFTIRAIPDNPPSVSLTAKPDDREYSAAEVVSFSYKAQDDVGLAEVVLRVEGGDDLPLKLAEYGAAFADSSATMAVSELASMAGKARELRFRVVARDVKGQEASSDVATIRLATDSVENQLRLVNQALTADPNGYRRADQSAVGRAIAKVTALRTGRGRLAAFIDSLNAGAKLEKEQLAAVREIESQLAVVRPRSVWGTCWYKDVVGRSLFDRFRAYVNYAVLVSELEGTDLSSGIRAAAEAAEPRAALSELLPSMDVAVKQQEAACERMKEIRVTVARELVGLLAATLESRLSRAPDQERATEQFLTANHKLLLEIVDLAEESLVNELTPARVESLRNAALDKNVGRGLGGVAPVLREVVAALAPKAFDAGVGLPDLLVVSDRILDESPRSEQLLIQLGTMLELENSDRFGDEYQFTQHAFRYLDAYRGMPGPFRPLGDLAPKARMEDEAIWSAFNALEWLRASAMDARMRLLAGQGGVTHPEFLDCWARMRESLITLEAARSRLGARPDVQAPLRTLLESSRPLRLWSPEPAMQEPDLVLLMRGLEEASGELCRLFEERRRVALAKARADAVTRMTDLKSGYEKVRSELADQAANYNDAGIALIQLRLSSMQIVVLKSLDLAEAARLAHVDDGANVDQLLGLYTVGGHLLGEFIRRVAIQVPDAVGAISGAGMASRERTTLADHAWKSRVEEYRRLDPLAASLLTVFSEGFSHEQVLAVLKPMLVTTKYSTERQMILAGANVERALANPRDLIAQFMADRLRAQAVYGRLLDQMHAIQQSFVSGAHQQVVNQSRELAATIAKMPELPAELRTIADLATRAGGMKDAQASGRSDIVGELAAAIEDLRYLMGVNGQARHGGSIGADQLTTARFAAAAALGARGAGAGDAVWSVARESFNRRREGLSRKNVASGGVGLVSDSAEELKLPKHLFLELKRARERAMPELFRDRAYEYLNAVLEKSR